MAGAGKESPLNPAPQLQFLSVFGLSRLNLFATDFRSILDGHRF